MVEIRQRLISVRGQQVLVDSDVARLYGVETKRINEAVRNNPDKFPDGYMFQLSLQETEDFRSKNSTTNLSAKSRGNPKVFTEKGLYMLATILKSKNAVNTTFAIIETFAAVRQLKRDLVDFHRTTDSDVQQSKLTQFGETLSELVMPDLETTETESSLELNFIIGKRMVVANSRSILNYKRRLRRLEH